MFLNFFQQKGAAREKKGEKTKRTKGFEKVLKISKLHLWCQSKSLWMKKARYAVKSGENISDKEAACAKSVPQSNLIKRTTYHNH